MTWTMSNGQTKKMQLSLVVSGETFKISLSLLSLTCTSAIWCLNNDILPNAHFYIVYVLIQDSFNIIIITIIIQGSKRPLLYSASLGTVLPQQWFFVVEALPKSEKGHVCQTNYICRHTIVSVIENTFMCTNDLLWVLICYVATVTATTFVAFVKKFVWKMLQGLDKSPDLHVEGTICKKHFFLKTDLGSKYEVVIPKVTNPEFPNEFVFVIRLRGGLGLVLLVVV